MLLKVSKNKRLIIVFFINLFVYIGLCVGFPTADYSRITFDAYDQLLMLITIFALNLFLYYIRDLVVDKLLLFIDLLIALVYAIFIVLGRAYIARGNLSLIWEKRSYLPMTVMSWIATSILLFIVFLAINKFSQKFAVNDLSFQKKSHKVVWSVNYIIILLCWLPYFVFSMPGIFSYDGMEQMNEFFRVKISGGQFVLTNHHPVFSTLIEGTFLKLGLKLFHSLNSGVLLNTIFLNLLTIAAFSTLISVVFFKFNKKFALGLLVFYAIFPVFPLWSNALDKTGYFTAFIVFFIASVISIDYSKTTYVSYIALFLTALLVGLTRNDGIIYVLFVLLGSFTLKHKKAILITLCLALLGIGITSNALVNLTGSLPTEPMESMAIPMQQIARVVKYNPQSLSSYQKRTINQFFKYRAMSKSFNPQFADATKGTARWPYREFPGNYKERRRKFNSQIFVKNKTKLLSTWITIGMHNKKLYLEALVAQNIYYVFPQNKPSFYRWAIGRNTQSIQLTSLTKKSNFLFPNRFYQSLGFLLNVSNIPLINLLFITFSWFALWLAGSLVLISKKEYQILNVLLLGLSIVLVALVSPVNGFIRYYQPLMIVVPVIISVAFSKKLKKVDR